MNAEPEQKDAYQQTIEEVLSAYSFDAQSELTEAEANTRLQKYGKNELASDPPTPAWKKFLAQFQDLLVILLLIATAISAALITGTFLW